MYISTLKDGACALMEHPTIDLILAIETVSLGKQTTTESIEAQRKKKTSTWTDDCRWF
ncbi:hypothetical protein PL8927_760223 [Planktothrix serta PCC 8927]|uniref:Uncharacterized protein n=1 Tax=Planktothrix serta PCC 8927 TaxID=671068 RepID=A0A7Z9BXJ3_9CYAN|nr:hypothetical protein PL8927_760223 [Planktothrix serta PCC 8927]